MTLAESVNLAEKLVEAPDRPQPDNFHSKTGHILPLEDSAVYQQLMKTSEYARRNEMKINLKKTKLMLFNPCTSLDFMPNSELDNQDIELVRNKAIRSYN